MMVSAGIVSQSSFLFLVVVCCSTAVSVGLFFLAEDSSSNKNANALLRRFLLPSWQKDSVDSNRSFSFPSEKETATLPKKKPSQIEQQQHRRSQTTTINGPFITADQSSELITIPNPPTPTIQTGNTRTNCPHLDNTLLDWHDYNTWMNAGLSPPTTVGADVTLPPNSRIVIHQSVTESLGIVTVPATSELIIGEDSVNNGITMNVHGMNVTGTLRAGSETCRLESPLTITLHGTRPSDIVTNSKPATYKGIAVTGLLELHGKQYYRTWSRLAKTVQPGDDYVVLQHAVNWEPGQEIILVTTAMKDSREWHENEILTIASVQTDPANLPPGSGVGAVVALTSPVQMLHVANNGYQAEVGLLSRAITIQGDPNDSEPSDPDPLTCTVTTRSNVYGNTGSHCPNSELTGYGGHIIVYQGGVGHVEGIELYRMGQTNVLGRYPIHYHLLESCPSCYFRDSSVHRSFYRCISVHGTHEMTVSENVAYDILGYCYYLEDGVEENNTIAYNLAAHVHWMGDEAPWGWGQTIPTVTQSNSLTLPADVTASGFYITNVHNDIIGNAASGGWAGFAFPVLHSPVGLHKTVNMRPSSRTGRTIDGNTAHSSGWWWYHTGAFYFGGSLYYDADGTTLVYNAGRDQGKGSRSPCYKDWCAAGNCDGYCQPEDKAWIRVTNSKAFLVPGPGLNSWSGRMEIIGYEAHDVGLAIESLESGFWIDNMLAVCRTGATLVFPPGGDARWIKGDGFFWYDTNQEHIITNAIFRKCGYRSPMYDQYDTSADRGCGDDAEMGCNDGSTVFGFLTHSDQFTPELMQGTNNIVFENCGRRFKLHDYRGSNAPSSTVSGRGQNWIDVDGSASGLGEPTLIGSGLSDAGLWWTVDDEVVHDPQGPLKFIKQSAGPTRGLGHIKIKWDSTIHDLVGSTYCSNGSGKPCDPLGYVKHFGPMFASDNGLPVTANADIVGPVGGFGWLVKLNNGAPQSLRIELIEVGPDTPLLLGIAYPLGTTFAITAHAAWCSLSAQYSCEESFHSVGSVEEVRTSLGNAYHFDDSGLLTVRIIMSPQTFTGNQNGWIKPDWNTVGKWGKWYAIDRFERAGVLLPIMAYGPWIDIVATCPQGTVGAYCAGTTPNIIPQVCADGFEQKAYDRCCSVSDPAVCQYADGSSSTGSSPTPSTPTMEPTTALPTSSPSSSPISLQTPTSDPSGSPTLLPTGSPLSAPDSGPTFPEYPSYMPSKSPTPVPVVPPSAPPPSGGSYCCSFNGYECGTSDRCNKSLKKCENVCDGEWLDPSTIVFGCCSWGSDTKNCGSDPWCGLNQENCEGSCNGNWQGIGGHCCSWNGYECPHSSDYCDFRPDQCETDCGGQWIDPSQAEFGCCSWSGGDCGSDAWCAFSQSNCEDTCSGTWLGIGGYCCSLDGQNCSSNQPSSCHERPDNCENTCGGQWMKP